MQSPGHSTLTVATLLAIAVAGCGNQNYAVGGSPARFSDSRAAGGAFTAKYSGSFTLTSCTPSKNGHFNFNGTGSAAFLHRSSESGQITDKRFGTVCVWSGSATLVSKRHSRNSITVSLGLNQGSHTSPCNNAVGFVVKSGTGKFAHASGSGTVTFNCAASTYTDAWSGTLTF